MKYIKTISFALLIISSVILVYNGFRFQKDYQRQKCNLSAMTDSLVTYKTKSDKIAYQNKVITLKYRELQDIVIPELEETVNDLKIKLKRVEMFSQNNIVITDTIQVPILDTIVIRDTVKLYAKKFNYNDDYTRINGIIHNDTVSLDYAISDTIIQVVHKGKYQHWWDVFLFRKRPLIQTISAKNPKSNILYSRVIKIEREKW